MTLRKLPPPVHILRTTYRELVFEWIAQYRTVENQLQIATNTFKQHDGYTTEDLTVEILDPGEPYRKTIVVGKICVYYNGEVKAYINAEHAHFFDDVAAVFRKLGQ